MIQPGGRMNTNLIDNSEVRKFGLVCFAVSVILSAAGLWREKYIPVILGVMFLMAGLSAVSVPGRFKPFYILWKKAAFTVSRFITSVILSAAYFLVITPSAIIKKISGGAPLNIRPDKNSGTYWVKRNEPLQPKERYLKRF